MAIALSQINAYDSHDFPVGFICSWKQLLWCNSLMESSSIMYNAYTTAIQQ